MQIPPIVIRVEIPGLSELAYFLLANWQADLDVMAASVKQATDSLRQSADALQGAVTNQTREQ